MFRRSTREFWKAGRQVEGYALFDFLHGYAYSRWPYAYIGMAKGDRKIPAILKPLVAAVAWLFLRSAAGPDRAVARQEFANRYHGKVVPPEAAAQLVTLDRPIELRNLEKIIPYTTAKDISLSKPDHIVALKCSCRTGAASPCLPLDVCLIIGEPFAGFILEHHPDSSRRISQAQAVEILEAEHERGHVHHAFFKDAMLGRFYAICNCCSCCCGAMQANRNGTPMLASSGYVVRRTAEACIACGQCVEACPFSALSLNEGALRIDESACMGCGVCVDRCSQNALALVREPAKGEPLILSELLADEPASS